ncbi:MAG TPA: hypothetical protein VFN77_00455, partial [Acetobacteraceae bacterium]|nr:hypothetical protein [Acetobacteraceae bacterium]
AVSAAGHITGMQPLDSAHLLDHLSNLGLKAEVERVLSMSPVPASALPGASIDEAAKDWWEKFNFLRLDALRQEFRDLDGHCRRNLDDAMAQTRLVQVREMLMRLEAGETDEEAVHPA